MSVHPVDQLAAIRQQIDILRRQQQNIHDTIMAGDVGTVGEHYKVSIRKQLILHQLVPDNPSVSQDSG